MIELKNICKSYGDTKVLENVNVKVNDHDVVAIIGPSGCGKSTMLNIFNILDKPTSGSVVFDGVDIAASDCKLENYRKKIGMVFQSFNLFNNKTILENVVDPQIDILKMNRQEAVDNAIKYLRLVGMADKKYSYPDELSGGQKQRAAIARTVAMKPELILMDEPTSALDPSMRQEVEYVIKKLAKSGITMIVVTHSMNFAKEIANRVFYIDDYGIYEDGTVDQIFNNPQREKTRQFIKILKCLDIKITSRDDDFISVIQKIEEFGKKLELDKKKIIEMQQLFEEICITNLFPKFSKDSYIRAVYEYSQKTNSVDLIITLSDDLVYDESSIDDISKSIIEAAKKDINLEIKQNTKDI